MPFEVGTNSTIRDLRKKFCDEMDLDISKTRFLLNGERLEDKSIIKMLNLEDSDKIEAFIECKGGGPPRNKKFLNSEEQILNALNESSECFDSDERQSETDLEVKKISDSRLDEQEIIDLKVPENKKEMIRDSPTKELSTDENSNQVLHDNCFEESHRFDEVQETNTDNDDWLDSVRSDFNHGMFDGTSSLHKKLKFYMKLPEISPVEQNIVKTLIERIKIHSEWESEKDQIFPQKEKKGRKRKERSSGDVDARCLRRKQNPPNQRNDVQETEDNVEITLPQIPIVEDDSRKNLFRVFGIVSPFIRQKVPTEEEVRRFSLSVHLWAEKVKGSVEFLQKTKLTDRHFKDMLVFAGPSSRWKLIPDRSVTEYKNLWQNAAKGVHQFHGDLETGFESMSGFHEASAQFCPFGHCQLNSALMHLTSPIKFTSTTSRRNLFKAGKTSKMEEDQATKPSPTKQELKEQNKLLQQEINALMSSKDPPKADTDEKVKRCLKKFTQPKIVKCNQDGCDKTFVTVFGLEQHLKKIHSVVDDIKKSKQECPFCGKETFYVDQHIKTVHKELSRNETCEVCKQSVKHDMKKHRSVCIFCPFCAYMNRKKDRLLRHIENNHRENSLQAQALDLTSPGKKEGYKSVKKTQKRKEQDMKEIKETEPLDSTYPSRCQDKAETDIEGCLIDVAQIEAQDLSTSMTDENNFDPSETVNQRRTKYPFDDKNEAYASEFEDGDNNELTLDRRNVKDDLEKELRKIDELTAKELEGDEEVLEQFETFMKNKTSRRNEEDGPLSGVSTVGIYKRALKNDLLPAFHMLFEPFDSRWILDCITPKVCTFEGQQRFHVKPEEPIYITSRVVQAALEMSKEKGGQQGGQRGTILNATVQFMNFIEIYFNQRLNLFGREPFESVIMYHKGVRTFISGTGAWKMCNDEKDKAQNENKIRESYLHPNKEAEVLKRYKKYIKSPERLNNLNKILMHSENEGKKPSDRELTEQGKIVMGEIAAATGCRPVVLLKLTNAAYIDKQPGFNPYKTTPDDCIVDEQDGADTIYRRVNPNLPPKNKACKHQLEDNVAECPVKCEDRCEPDGYNLFITWDKTYGTKGPSYLHIPKELKHMMDIYDIKRIRYFKGRKSPFNSNADWIHDDSTPFFLNSACSPFKTLDLKHVTEAMGIHVTAYNYRKIVSTWARSHASEEIRLAEEEALQHSLRVADADYQQNKQIKPQKLTQRYIEEEGLFPESFKEGIEKTKSIVSSAIKSTEDKRTKKRIKTLLERNAAYKTLRSENRPLGPNHRILSSQRKAFLKLVQEVTNTDVDKCLIDKKPTQWRHFCVRTVCTAKGVQGEELRTLWKAMYQGDLRWGIRDARLRAKERNWPRNKVTNRRDRNSWIAASIRQSHITGGKRQEKSTKGN